MGKSLYFECASGISGDMTVAALLDLGADREKLLRALDTVPADGFSIEISRVKKSGIDCQDFDVKLDAAHENHDHDMAYLHGNEHHDHDHDAHDHHHDYDHDAHDHHHDHDHDAHNHHHDHEHEHDGHEHHHEHRHLSDVFAIIDGTELTDGARALAKKMFAIVAEAEAQAHGLPLEEVHFHEVGAIDSIVDVIAIAVCFDDLGITDVIVKSVTEGTGTVRCQHGVLPVPVPAVTNIARAHALPLRIADVRGEFVTPTGAAFLAAVRTSDSLPEGFRIVRTGLGAGKREYALPSILRAMIIETANGHEAAGCARDAADAQTAGAQDDGTGAIWKLETDIDDSTGEELGLVAELLMEAGAREAHYAPVIMKKGRPAWTLTVLCTEERRTALEEIIFRQTTAIGIRRCRMERTILARDQKTITLPGISERPIRVKVCALPAAAGDGNAAENGEEKRCYPEYDDVATIARATGRSYREIYAEARKAAAK